VCGLIALAAVAREIAEPQRRGASARDRSEGTGVIAMWIAIAGALWLGEAATLGVFMVLSIGLLALFLASPRNHGGGTWPQLACCFACVPVQYAAIATGRVEVFVVLVPLIAALAIPMWGLLHGETRAVVERSSNRWWGVMLWVYGLSHVPALGTLRPRSTDAYDTGIVAFVVVLALVARFAWWLTSRTPAAANRMPTGMSKLRSGGTCMLAVPVAGWLLRDVTPFGAPEALALAALIAIAAGLGCIVVDAVRREGAHRELRSPLGDVLDPGALALAAPLVFHAVRAWTLLS